MQDNLLCYNRSAVLFDRCFLGQRVSERERGGPVTTQPDPEFRISTFGILAIKRLVLPRGLPPRYAVLSDDIWNKRYHGKKLLKALLCCDYRQASKDVLMEKLWPDAGPGERQPQPRRGCPSPVRRAVLTPTLMMLDTY